MTPSTATGSPPRVLWLVGLAAAVLLALLISPATRWLVHSQATADGLTVQTSAVRAARGAAAQRAFVAAHPDDVQVQIAAAITGQVAGSVSDHPGQAQRIAALRALTARFPNSPSVYANLLRHEIGYPPQSRALSGTGVYLRRQEDWSISEVDRPPSATVPPPPAPELLAAFDADAAAGGRLDRSNAYFPMMRAVGLFAAHRDSEGLEAVRRAGTKSTWREYIPDEMEGRLRVADASWGHTPFAGRIMVVASVLYPQYADLRSVARVTAALAMADEQAGHVTAGLATRRALLRVGGLMRGDSETYIGSLVGRAVAAIATSRPGGAPPVGSQPGTEQVPREKAAQLRLEQFVDYAQRAGHPEDATLAEAEVSAGTAAGAVFNPGEDHSPFAARSITRLATWWIADLVTVANILWLMVLAAAASLLSRLPAVRVGRPLTGPARWGIVTAVAAGMLILWANTDTAFPITVLLLVTVACFACLGAVRLLRASPVERAAASLWARQFVQSFIVSSGALLCLIGLAAWLGHGIVDYGNTLRDLWATMGFGDLVATNRDQSQQVRLSEILEGMILPLLMLIVLSIAGLVRRVPVSVALVRGFRSAALPTACVLVLIYGVLALGTARQEQMMTASMEQSIGHEGAYYAALARMPWPGPPTG